MSVAEITVEVRNIHRSYRGQDLMSPGETSAIEVLKGVDLTICRGETVALMGPSGSGKSTLLNILGLLETPTEGTLRLLNRQVSFSDSSTLVQTRRRDLGFVFQSFNLISTLTVEENISVPLLLLGSSRKLITERTNALLKKAELVHRRHHLPSQLSGGEMQRVAVCRALVHQPSILLADEPTGNLDGVSATAVIALLNEAASELNCSVIVATHSQEAAAQCSRILHLHYGQITTPSSNISV